MLDKLLSPFVGYWYWAQDRATPLTRGLALGAPLVVFGLFLYVLFGRGGDDSSLIPDVTSTQGNIAVGTQTPEASVAPTQPAGTGVGQATGAGTTGAAQPTTTAGGSATGATGASATAQPGSTAFSQQRYTVVAGDSPSAIAEKVGVPANIRASWIEEMLALNGVSATTLQVGQELILPPF